LFIRQETQSDYNEVYNLILEAFKTAEHTDGNEHNLVEALRKSSSFVSELSLVAEINKEIVGHILFTKAYVGDNEVLALAPLSVKPKFQKQGVGTALIKKGHEIAKNMGYQYSIVLGSELYYPKLGYIPAKNFGIEVLEGIPSKNFMAIKLKENVTPISGKIVYAKEFGM